MYEFILFEEKTGQMLADTWDKKMLVKKPNCLEYIVSIYFNERVRVLEKLDLFQSEQISPLCISESFDEERTRLCQYHIGKS